MSQSVDINKQTKNLKLLVRTILFICLSFQVEKFHTELALTYLEKLSSQDTNFLEPFRNHLLHSDQIQFKYLLSKVEASPASNNLLHEKAILYGKVSNFCLYYHLGYFSSSRPKFMCQQPFLNLLCWVEPIFLYSQIK